MADLKTTAQHVTDNTHTHITRVASWDFIIIMLALGVNSSTLR